MLSYVFRNILFMKPISKYLGYRQYQEPKKEDHFKLGQLKKLLALNFKTQEKLKNIRDSLAERMSDLEEFISTRRLKNQYPPASNIISYMKFERNIPPSNGRQSKVIQQQEAIKSTSQKDCDFINRLSNAKSKKKKMVELPELSRDPSLINFAQIALEAGSKNGIQIYKEWYDRNHNKVPKRPFERYEQMMIIEKQKIFGDNWQKICQFVDNRTFQQIYYEFHNRINPKLQSGRWNLRYSLMLIILVQHFGTKRWAVISQRIGVKGQLQVRERYCNILDPSLGRNQWTPQLEERLVEIAPEYKYCWKEIAKLPLFQNKTDNCLWRKYRNIMINRSQNQIRAYMPNGNQKGLIDKIMKVKQATQAKKKPPPIFRPFPIFRMKCEQNYIIKPCNSNKYEDEEIKRLEEPDNSLPYIIYE